MTTLEELHDILDASLATIEGLRHSPDPPTQFHGVVAYPVLEGWTQEAMGRGGLKTYTFNVIILVGKGVRIEDGYRTLMRYADSEGDQSIEMALWDGNNTDADGDSEAGSYRGLAGVNVHVESFEVLGVVDIGTSQTFGGRFELKVRTRSS